LKESLIHIENCQIKSLNKAKAVAAALDIIEKEMGVGSVRISFKNCFVCPDINLLELYNSVDPMERVMGKIFIMLDKKKYGKRSDYRKIKFKTF
jgi:hypothetical protein